MKNLSRRLRSLIALSAAAAFGMAHAAYPDKPVKLIVPFSPGGGNDQIGRLFAEKLGQATSNSFFVENRAGAGGNIGAEVVARSPADGYTLLVVANQIVINPWLYPKMSFDVMKDLKPVALVADVQFLLVSNPTVAATTVPELIALDKKQPGGLNHGTPGSGTPQHLAAELFNLTAGTTFVHVPYKGTGPAISDLVGGQVQLGFVTLSSIAPFVTSGRVRALAATGTKRSPLLPDVPTVAESGVKGYDATTWYGFMAPAGTPPAVIATLEKHLQAALADPAFRSKLQETGFEVHYVGSDAMEATMQSDLAKWGKLIKAAHVKLD